MSATAQPTQGLRILFADDNVLLGEVLVRLFSLAGHRPEHVHDGHEAWKRLSQAPENYDVLVTDNRMPGMGGLELVRRARKLGFPGAVVVHSAILTEQEIAAYRSMYVDLILFKNRPAQELLRIFDAFSLARAKGQLPGSGGRSIIDPPSSEKEDGPFHEHYPCRNGRSQVP